MLVLFLFHPFKQRSLSLCTSLSPPPSLSFSSYVHMYKKKFHLRIMLAVIFFYFVWDVAILFFMNISDGDDVEEEIKMLVELIFAFNWTFTIVLPCCITENAICYFFFVKKKRILFLASYKHVRIINKKAYKHTHTYCGIERVKERWKMFCVWILGCCCCGFFYFTHFIKRSSFQKWKTSFGIYKTVARAMIVCLLP